MASTTKLETAKALFPLLSVFHQVSGALLETVRQIVSEESITVLILDFGSKALVIEGEADDDTVTISIGTGATRGGAINDQRGSI